MNSSDSLQIDEHLARLLAAYDQSVEGADAAAQTISVQRPAVQPPRPGERAVTPMTGSPNQGPVQEVLPDSGRGSSDWLPRPATTPAPPGGIHRVGRFELRRQLGKGGCGIVFLAYDPKLEREVALKIPRPEMLLSADARRRFIREALAAAEFDHPNLVPVYETGEIGPVCFIATAFCPGQTLGEWLDRQAFPVPLRQAARLVAAISDAVQHAHDRGVLHRDLKPNNVVLQEVKDDPNQVDPPVGSCQLRGEHFIPRIVDFGLAKLLERGGPSETTTRQVLGTPKYMAPEQAQARHDDVGPAADVYALGVILYELLTGRAPYEGETDVEVLRQAIDGVLTPPRRLRTDLPRDLEAICLKAMARSPVRRYRTAIDFADDLRRFLDGKPTLARPLKWLGRAAKWLRRNDQAVALTVVTAIAMMLLAFWLTSNYQTRQLRTDRDKVLKEQSERYRLDRHWLYTREVRDAFLAWRAGDMRAAAKALEVANQLAAVAGESPDFAHNYLAALTSAERATIVCPAGPITAMAASADGAYLATGHENGTVSVWVRSTGDLRGSARAHDRAIAHVAFAHGEELVSADAAGSVRSWLVTAAGQLTAGNLTPVRVPPTPPRVPAVRVGNRYYTGGDDGVVRAYDSPAGESLVAVHLLPDPAEEIGITGEDSRILIKTDRPSILSFPRSNSEPSVADPPGTFVSFLAPKDRRPLALTLQDGSAAVFELLPAGPEARFRYRPAEGRATAVAMTGDGGKLAVGDASGRVSMLAGAERTLVWASAVGDGAVGKLILSDDGRTIAAKVGDRIVLTGILEISPRATFPADEATVFRFTPDGGRLVMAGSRGAIQVVKTDSGRTEYTLYGHAGQVTGLTISPDGRTLASGGVNGEVRFWDLRTGQEAMSFRRHRGPVTALEFSFDGKLLVTAGTELATWAAEKE